MRVKPGVPDPDYPDIPLGGWAGTVREANTRRQPATYLIQWDPHTLAHMHPIFQQRCLRDDLDVDSMWLDEQDIEPATGEPAPMEQPSRIVTLPLDPADQEDRVRAMLGLTSDDPLPEVDEANLRTCQRYLSEHLSFPFEVRYMEVTESFEMKPRTATVRRLSEQLQVLETEEIHADVGTGEGALLLPLAALQVAAKGPNRRLVEDYFYWFSQWGEAGDLHPFLGALQPVDSPAPPLGFRGIAKQFLWAALYGGIYGLLLGTMLGTVEPALLGAGIGAALLALIGFFKGVDSSVTLDTVDGLLTGTIFGRLLSAGVTGVVGSLVGAGVAVLIVAYPGTLIGGFAGALLGGLLAKATAKHGGILGWGFVGTCLGALILAIIRNHEAAVIGALYGAAAGAVVGILGFLLLAGVVRWLAKGLGG